MGKQTTDQPAPAGGRRRVQVDKLLPEEQQELKEQGIDLSGDFVDVSEPTAKPMVDAAASERAAAVSGLESVVRKPLPAAETPPAVENSELSEELSGLNKRCQQLQKQVDEHVNHCPRCAWPVAEPVKYEPSSDDIQTFLESICAGEVWVKSFELYGGKLLVTFRTRYACEMDAIKDYINEQSQGVVSGDTLYLMDEMVFLASLKEIELDGRKKSYSDLRDLQKQRQEVLKAQEERVKTVGELLRDRIADLPSQIKIAMREKFVEFSSLVEHLMVKSTDPKYWRGTGN